MTLSVQSLVTRLPRKVTLASVVTAVVFAVLAGTGSAATPPTSLFAGQNLAVQGSLVSPDGGVKLTVQTDGNLVLYNRNSVAIWNTNTAGTGPNNKLSMQTDGNLVLYTPANGALWNSRTRGKGNTATVQNDGNFVIYSATHKALWSTGTAGMQGNFVPQCTAAGTATGVAVASSLYSYAYPSPQYYTLIDASSGSQLCQLTSPDKLHRAVMQPDGNFVVYNALGRATWNSGTAGSKLQWVQIDTNGVLSIGGTTGDHVLATSKSSNIGVRLTMQNDGNLVFYTASGVAVWSTSTSGQ